VHVITPGPKLIEQQACLPVNETASYPEMENSSSYFGGWIGIQVDG